MRESPTELYLAGFRARRAARCGAGDQLVESPGVDGALSADGRLNIVVTDDIAIDVLADLVTTAQSGTVTVFDSASHCVDLLRARAEWVGSAATAMSCPDLDAVAARPLPAGLDVRPVYRTADDDPSGIPLADAATLAHAVDPGVDSVSGLVEHLSRMPGTTHLMAAVDEHGEVQATSGHSVYGRHAQVMFVNTAAAWQGRGVGSAMTSEAVIAARESGARHAFLDATDAGRGLYERLGFEIASLTTRFSRPD